MLKYKLNVFSKKKSANFEEHDVEGIKKIGVDRGEEFAIHFSNDSNKPIQVLLSVDGTNVLTGEPASRNISDRMFFVGPYTNLRLEAWPEDNRQGRQFVFGDDRLGVAKNTHGDTRGVGIIAAAVFEEYTPPHAPDWWPSVDWYGVQQYGSQQYDVQLNSVRSSDFSARGRSLSAKPAVGAGDVINQPLRKVAGLSSPTYAFTLEVHYEWWDTLKTQLRQQTAFPGERPALAEKREVFNPSLKRVPKTITYRY